MFKFSKTLLILSILVAAGCAEKVAGSYDLAMVAMISDVHFLRAGEGGEAKAKELGATLNFQAPVTRVDIGAQLQMVEDAIARKSDAIILAAADADAFAPIVDKAYEQNIPVFYLNTVTKSSNYISQVSTDNFAAGVQAGKEMLKRVQTGEVAILHVQAGLASVLQRGEGFKEAIKGSGLKVIAELYADGDTTKALNQSLDLLTANPNMVGLYGSNVETSVGIARALEEKNMTDKVVGIGFDIDENVGRGVESGALDAVMVQNPTKMGELTVQYAVDYLNGNRDFPKFVDTGINTVTSENLKDFL